VMSAKDFARFRGAIQPALTAGMQAILRDRMSGVDVDAVLRARFCRAPGPWPVRAQDRDQPPGQPW
jgi:hypothetical protein